MAQKSDFRKPQVEHLESRRVFDATGALADYAELVLEDLDAQFYAEHESSIYFARQGEGKIWESDPGGDTELIAEVEGRITSGHLVNGNLAFTVNADPTCSIWNTREENVDLWISDLTNEVTEKTAGVGYWCEVPVSANSDIVELLGDASIEFIEATDDKQIVIANSWGDDVGRGSIWTTDGTPDKSVNGAIFDYRSRCLDPESCRTQWEVVFREPSGFRRQSKPLFI